MLSLLCLVCLAFLACDGAALAQGDILKDQKEKAQANWKRGTRSEEMPNSTETEHLLVYGKAEKAKIAAIGAQLQKQYTLAVTALDAKKEDMWRGKLTVYLVPDRRKFTAFVRRVEVRRIYSDEKGTFRIRTDYPHVIAGPAVESGDLSVVEQAGAQLAAAVMKKKFKDVPSWVLEGFGRATVLQSSAKKRIFAEKNRLLTLIADKKRKAADAWSAATPAGEAAMIRGSILRLMAYSGATKLFLPFLKGFRVNQNGQPTSAVEALRTGGINLATLEKVWPVWVKTMR